MIESFCIGHDSFTSIRVFIDGCDQTDPNSVCDLEGNLYPCCHIDAGSTIQGSLIMINEEDLVSNGDISCDGVGWGKQQSCIDPEFCNGVNSTCPIAGGASVEFKFGLSTDGWTPISVSKVVIQHSVYEARTFCSS